MEDQKQPIDCDEREIDLIDLMGRFFSWLGRVCKSALKNTVYFLVRNFFFYLVGIALVVVLTMWQGKFVSMYYYCEMVVQSKAINSAEAINLVNNWNYLSQMPDSLANNIRSIKSTFVLDYNRDGIGDDFETFSGKSQSDTVILNSRLSDVFCVQAQFYNANNRAMLAEIKNELFKYLGNDNWVIICNKNRLEGTQAKIDRINKEIAVLDSLELTDYFDASKKYQMDRNGALMIVSEKEKYLYHNDIFELLELKREVERDFYPEPFKIIQDFSTPMVSVNNTSNNFRQNLIVILIITTFVALLFDQRKNIKLLIQKAKRRED